MVTNIQLYLQHFAHLLQDHHHHHHYWVELLLQQDFGTVVVVHVGVHLEQAVLQCIVIQMLCLLLQLEINGEQNSMVELHYLSNLEEVTGWQLVVENALK